MSDSGREKLGDAASVALAMAHFALTSLLIEKGLLKVTDYNLRIETAAKAMADRGHKEAADLMRTLKFEAIDSEASK